jgi:hypothetical protein
VKSGSWACTPKERKQAASHHGATYFRERLMSGGLLEREC